MPIDFKKIMENKPLFYGIIGGVVVLLLLFIIVGVAVSSGNNSKPNVVKEKIIKEPYDLFTTDKIGQALEVQALLARQGIKVQRRVDGTKSTLFLENYTQSEKDQALLAVVRSGIVDQHIGLEIFDNGDFTSTKEDSISSASSKRLYINSPTLVNPSAFATHLYIPSLSAVTFCSTTSNNPAANSSLAIYLISLFSPSPGTLNT